MPSENGWEPAKATVDQCEWITVPGTDPPVHLELLKGQPLLIMRAFAADYNAYIEPVYEDDSAARTETNSVPTSNHLNGTAMDLRWNSHPFQVRGTFNASQMTTIRELLDWYENCMWWGGDWTDPIDEMHWNMGYDTYGNPHTQDFITRKIRADGFSTFRRDPAPPPPADPRDAAAAEIIGQCARRSWGRDPAVACLSTGIQESGLNQDATDPTGHRGVYQQDSGYPDRETLAGNVAGFFDRLDAKLASPGASPDIWKNIFWLQQRPSEPSADAAYADGRQHYLIEIQSHVDDANALFDRLATAPPPPPPPPPAPPPAPGDDMAQVPQAQWDALFRAVMDQRQSRSPLRHLGEGVVGDAPDQVWDIDGSVHVLVVKMLAELGSPNDLALLREVATADPVTHPDRQNDAVLAATILARISEHPASVPPTPAAPLPLPAPAPAPVDATSSTGQLIGRAYDALDALQLGADVPDNVKAPLTALIAVLQSYPSAPKAAQK